ncbi:MAG: MFS transporter [Erysipelotrichaceae bacterium]|nr:MFS transporter [Erysipelotrichaceae bacterium]
MNQGLSKKAKWLYGLCLMGGNFVYMLTASFTVMYYQTYLGLNPAFVGAILMVARVFDAINDPLTGIIVAKVNTKWGKFRPWILSGSIVNALTLFALFAAPVGIQSKEGSLMIWYAVTYLLWSTTYDAFDIPIWSIVPAVTDQGPERESMATIGRTFAAIGCGIVSVAAPIVIPMLGGGDANNYSHWITGFKWFTLIVCVYYILSSFVFYRNVHEKHQVDDGEKSPTIKEMFKALFANSQAIVIVIAITAVNIGTGITGNLMPYFFHFDLGGADWNSNYSLITMVIFAGQVLGSMVVYPMIRKFFNRKGIFSFSLILAIAGYVLLFAMSMFKNVTTMLLFIPSILIGVSTGILNILTTVYLADAVDYGEVENGRRDESVVFSMQTFVVKLASGLSAGLTGLVVALIGLNTTENAWVDGLNSQGTLFILRLVMAVIPVFALGFALMYYAKKFILDEKKMEEIDAVLKSRQ